jgi:hypothetical protein
VRSKHRGEAARVDILLGVVIVATWCEIARRVFAQRRARIALSERAEHRVEFEAARLFFARESALAD